MNEEQIRQKARVYTNKEYMLCTSGEKEAAIKDFIAGAHSRDEEIAELKEEIESLKENEKELFEGFKKRGTKLGELMKENVKLRNPWISVEDRLPKEDKDKEARSLSLSINTDENTRNSIYDALLTMADYVDSYPKNNWRDAKKDPPKREIGNKICYTFLDTAFNGVSETRYYHYAEFKKYGFGNEGWFDEDGNLVLVGIADFWMPIPEVKKGERYEQV